MCLEFVETTREQIEVWKQGQIMGCIMESKMLELGFYACHGSCKRLERKLLPLNSDDMGEIIQKINELRADIS